MSGYKLIEFEMGTGPPLFAGWSAKRYWGPGFTYNELSNSEHAFGRELLYDHAECERCAARGDSAGRYSTALCFAQRSPVDWPAVRLRTRAVRSLFRFDRWQGSAFLRHSCRQRCQAGNHYARRFACEVGKAKGPLGGPGEKYAASRSAGVDRRANSAVRLLSERHDDQGHRVAGKQSKPTLGANQERLHPTPGPSPNLCRCGTYVAIIEAVRQGARSWRKRN